AVEGLPAPSLASAGPGDPPSLIIRPFHQAGAVISLRQFTNNAFNHHHGIQTTERFGDGTDPDADGFVDEMTRADVTAATLFQATLPVPGRVIPNDPVIEAAVLNGESRFDAIGCPDCHIPSLPLYDDGWIFTEPNPFNPAGNLQPGEAAELSVDLNDHRLPQPRLRKSKGGTVWVPAFTDLKLHDITSGPGDPNREPLDMHHPAGSPEFFAGNSHFLTRKLWGIANEPPFFHHGQYTTMRQAIEAHAGEAQAQRDAWDLLSDYDRDSIIEFLKTLQVLPAGTRFLIVDEKGNHKPWPPQHGRR
ncbi:MAG: di-heme oxidoredictase family protein, partial [Thermoanaerobaculia bacterium]|nr:di-heme oxidoredictase family protein [Thermoanaerobaculia bacterium]